MIATDVVGVATASVGAALCLALILWCMKHPVRWLWRTNLAEPIGKWGKALVGGEIEERLAPLISQVDQIQAAIGPKNGSTIGEKVANLTRVQARIVNTIDSFAAEAVATATAVEDIVHAEHEQTRASQHVGTVVQINQTAPEAS